MIQALGIEDVVQCPLASTGCTSGTRDRWSSSMNLFTRPLLPTLVGLLVHVTPWCRRSRLRSPDEVLSLFVDGDVEVRFPEQLLGGGRRFLQYGSDEGRVIRSPVEVLNHCCFSDLGDVISHGLKPPVVQSKHFIPRRLMDLRSHDCAGLSEWDWKLVIKRRPKLLQSSMQCRGRCHSHCNILPEDDGQVRSHYIFRCPSGPGSGRIDGQPASRVLLRLIFVYVGDLEVRGH
jgi:hypothetical protein